jgi:hypothetical protein
MKKMSILIKSMEKKTKDKHIYNDFVNVISDSLLVQNQLFHFQKIFGALARDLKISNKTFELKMAISSILEVVTPFIID